MGILPKPIEQLIREFDQFPGVGPKTSERYVFYLLRQPKEALLRLAGLLARVKDATKVCNECFQISEASPCVVCANPDRNKRVICVVEDTQDVLAIENARDFSGVYHVLGGVIKHMEGIGPDKLRIEELLDRIERDGVEEIILATNPDLEGETTATYIAKKLEGKTVRITRIARGLPTGSDLDYADAQTLSNALQGRSEYKKIPAEVKSRS